MDVEPEHDQQEAGSDQESESVEVEIVDGVCPACDQEFGNPDEDADGDTSITVTSAKGDNRALCHRCFYIGRGSLGKLKMIDLVKLLKKSTALRKKFRSLRKAHLKAVLKNPKAKPRHQVLDLKHYTKKKQSNYEAEWTELSAYFNEKAPADVRKKVLGLKLQQDDRGIEGVLVMADSSKKKVRIGSKVSTESVRQAEHESGTARNQAHEKESEKLQMQINEKAEEDEALGGPLEAPDEPEEEDGHASDSESSDAGFNLMRDSKMKASASTRKPKTKRSEEIKKPSESIPVTEAKSKQTRKPDKDLIPKGESTVLDLRRFSETGFLAGTVKEKDWGSKLTKALALASQLEQVMNNDMCKDLAKTLTEEANGVSNAMDTVKVFRNMTPAVAARELIALSDEFLSRM
ncbi:unnamed protein product, partial [Durusdinium trenchii]